MSGVTAIDVSSLTVAARIPTGKGHHEIVLSGDDRYIFVTNRDEGTVSVIDAQQLKKVKDIRTGPLPISISFSPRSAALYVADGKEGIVSVIDSKRLEIVARINVQPGLGPIRFTPDGRWAFLVNSRENAVHVIDAATNRLAYTIPVGAEPYQVLFTATFAHVRSLGTEHVNLIALSELGKDSLPPPNTYAAGAHPPNDARELGISSVMIPAISEPAVLVASPADNAIYYYMEGMTAPSGSFQTYGHTVQAIEIVDRSLRARAPGVYSTTVKLPVAGAYDVAFLLDSPRVVHCFNLTVQANPNIKHAGPPLKVEYLITQRNVSVSEETKFAFRLVDTETGKLRTGLKDVIVHYYMVPGLHRTQLPAKEVAEGVYETKLSLPEAGAYYVYVACPSMKIRPIDLPYRTLLATQRTPTSGESQ